MTVKLYRSKNGIHKFMAVFPNGKVVRFGRKGYSDYTIHKDKKRMERYLVRHKTRENWKKGGGQTAGFWSRWLLWSKPSLQAALRQTQKVLGQKIVFAK
jgi:hypothetical protein